MRVELINIDQSTFIFTCLDCTSIKLFNITLYSLRIISIMNFVSLYHISNFVGHYPYRSLNAGHQIILLMPKNYTSQSGFLQRPAGDKHFQAHV